MMMASVREIAWDDLTEAIPAFLTMVMMPLTVSITDGIAFGFIAYAVLKLGTGRGGRRTGWCYRVRGAVRGALRLADVAMDRGPWTANREPLNSEPSVLYDRLE